MRAKRIIAVMAGPLAAAALTFSPVLTAQAAAATQAPAASAPQAPEAQSPGQRGGTDGRAAGAKDGKRCNWGTSENPEAKKTAFKRAKDYKAYEDAYEAAYLKAYEESDNACDPNED
ncbi:hypothetical protein [Streptomyces naphthomycinicus]|uniref:hypothetical protein n=1 Tax=Streptomyces naphthomycinicus TaxID=2872625 RepID=UPI001CED0436|nr:hypothetical protein [Streptomyces sp. TML10]